MEAESSNKSPQEIVNSVSTEIFSSVKSMIGFNRYTFLKSLSVEDLTEEEISQMKNYEEKHFQTPEQKENQDNYMKKVRMPVVEIDQKFTKNELWKLFVKTFREVHGKEFVYNDEVLENIKPLMYYFMEDDNFFSCKNLSKLSEPSFDKGLLIIGNFGNGKTATMEVFEKIFKTFKSISFKGYSANEVVNMFEKINPLLKDQILTRSEFDKMMHSGKRYFDDVKTERHASNFGKMNLMKDILEVREKNNLKTHITCNFKDGFDNDIQAGLDEFEEKYGSRLYDRLFKMFNIIEFKGKSFRR
jgi:hypothetical protein